MGGSVTQKRLLTTFPFLGRAPDALTEELLSASRYQQIPADMLVKMAGDECHDFVLMLSGGKRIFELGSSSREITLYEIGPGDICVLNATSILSNTPLPANASTLSETEVLLVSRDRFLRLFNDFTRFREFIHHRINFAMVSVMSLISEICFGKMDERLVEYLIEQSEDHVLTKTHREIANDLGTSREVISRLLEEFKRNGEVELLRGKVILKPGFF